MTKTEESSPEKEESQRVEEGMKNALNSIKDIKLMLDTNVLITACDGSSAQRQLIAGIAGNNDTYICDTVFWEFVRNCNLKKFRERHIFLSDREFMKVEHEDSDVKKMYQAIWATYLCFYSGEPKKMAALAIPDLWIVATTVQRGIDNILTSDNSDFPDVLFEKEAFYIGKGKSITLMKFDRNKSKSYLLDALNNGVLVDFRSYREPS